MASYCGEGSTWGTEGGATGVSGVLSQTLDHPPDPQSPQPSAVCGVLPGHPSASLQLTNPATSVKSHQLLSPHLLMRKQLLKGFQPQAGAGGLGPVHSMVPLDEPKFLN